MKAIRLRDGSETADRRLGRLIQFDERSREHPIRTLVPRKLASKTWPLKIRLDQGTEGACVGFSISHELAASPCIVREVDGAFARQLYNRAKKLDGFPGEAYEGTSVLAGMKAAKEAGYLKGYRWAFGIDDVLRALSHAGPVVLGISWLDSMFEPAPTGLLDCSGKAAGGHAILARGLTLYPRIKGLAHGTPVVRLTNSWGAGYGIGGDCFITVEDLEKLLDDDGEAAVPLERCKTGQLRKLARR